MIQVTKRTEEIQDARPGAVCFNKLIEADKPVILKGYAKDWPLVRKGLQSARSAADYILRFYSGRPVAGYTAAADLRGRFFYNDDLTGLNFKAERVDLKDYLERLFADFAKPDSPSYYVGSTDTDVYLPGFRGENDLALNEPEFHMSPIFVSMWIGNRTTASCHFDMSNNIAVCAAGHRRFTLFPPDQAANLYPGPLEPTPGGQVVTMVDFQNPDFGKFPRFAEAIKTAEVAELEPGDALVYPALWWHHVEGLDDFNVLVNYWWNAVPRFMDTPMNTLLHAFLSLRDRPEQEKRAWKDLFDYYIFGAPEQAGAHLPEHARGALGAMDELTARKLRAQLLQRLNR